MQWEIRVSQEEEVFSDEKGNFRNVVKRKSIQIR